MHKRRNPVLIAPAVPSGHARLAQTVVRISGSALPGWLIEVDDVAAKA